MPFTDAVKTTRGGFVLETVKVFAATTPVSMAPNTVSCETQWKFLVGRSGRISVPAELATGGELPAMVEQVSAAKICSGIRAKTAMTTKPSTLATRRRTRKKVSIPSTKRSREAVAGSGTVEMSWI